MQGVLRILYYLYLIVLPLFMGRYLFHQNDSVVFTSNAISILSSDVDSFKLYGLNSPFDFNTGRRASISSFTISSLCLKHDTFLYLYSADRFSNCCARFVIGLLFDCSKHYVYYCENPAYLYARRSSSHT